MARPAKSLLRRCQEQSFRACHHARLLVTAPDLPHPALLVLQQRACAAQTEDELHAIAREFQRALTRLPADELPPPRPPVVAPPSERPSPDARRARNEALVADVGAALVRLEVGLGTQLSAVEQIEAELIQRTAERLAEVDGRLSADGLVVAGSRRQLRQHPLLALEARLRRELIRGLQQFEFRVGNRAQLERLKALTTARERPASSRPQPAGHSRRGPAGATEQPSGRGRAR
jgi:hypothetical protein